MGKSAHKRKLLGGNREKEQERGRGRLRERERVGEIMKQFGKGERDHMNSAESVCVRKRWCMNVQICKK